MVVAPASGRVCRRGDACVGGVGGVAPGSVGGVGGAPGLRHRRRGVRRRGGACASAPARPRWTVAPSIGGGTGVVLAAPASGRVCRRGDACASEAGGLPRRLAPASGWHRRRGGGTGVGMGMRTGRRLCERAWARLLPLVVPAPASWGGTGVGTGVRTGRCLCERPCPAALDGGTVDRGWHRRRGGRTGVGTGVPARRCLCRRGRRGRPGVWHRRRGGTGVVVVAPASGRGCRRGDACASEAGGSPRPPAPASWWYRRRGGTGVLVVPASGRVCGVHSAACLTRRLRERGRAACGGAARP